jgi:hypothetical protein
MMEVELFPFPIHLEGKYAYSVNHILLHRVLFRISRRNVK